MSFAILVALSNPALKTRKCFFCRVQCCIFFDGIVDMSTHRGRELFPGFSHVGAMTMEERASRMFLNPKSLGDFAGNELSSQRRAFQHVKAAKPAVAIRQVG